MHNQLKKLKGVDNGNLYSRIVSCFIFTIWESLFFTFAVGLMQYEIKALQLTKLLVAGLLWHQGSQLQYFKEKKTKYFDDLL